MTLDEFGKLDKIDIRSHFNVMKPEKQRIEARRNMRLDQYQRWMHVKDLYAEHRDELSDTLGEPRFEQAKVIIEGVFTMEVDDALRDVIE
jgi:hypothetical protein